MRYCRCGAIVDKRCPRCDKEKSASKRGYDRRWRKVREKVLADQPVCVDCEKEGKTRAAVEVHHLKSITAAPHLRLNRENLVPLCQHCHDKRHGGKNQRTWERNYESGRT